MMTADSYGVRRPSALQKRSKQRLAECCCCMSIFALIFCHHSTINSFQFTTKLSHRWNRNTLPVTVLLSDYINGRKGGGKPYDRRRSSLGGGEMKSKRQERVAQIVKTELSQIIHSGLIKGVNAEYLDDELRTRISVVNTDVSPDLRQARISISIRPTPRSQQQISNDDFYNNEDDEGGEENFLDDEDEEDDYLEEDIDEDGGDDFIGEEEIIAEQEDEGDDEEDDNDDYEEDANTNLSDGLNNLQNEIQQQRRTSPAVDRRRAFAWLVRNTKPIRYTLAQRMSHMKSCPDLTFVQVDVSAAVDVMYLIDKLSSTDGKFKRDNLDLFSEEDVARGIVGGLDFDAVDEDEDDMDWDEDDVDFLKTK